MDGVEAQFVCVGHVNTAKIVWGFDCKWCGGRKLYSTRELSWKSDLLTNLARRTACLPACCPEPRVWVFFWHGGVMPGCCWGFVICSSIFEGSCWQMFAALKTTPAPQKEQSHSTLLDHFPRTLKSSNNHLFAKRFAFAWFGSVFIHPIAGHRWLIKCIKLWVRMGIIFVLTVLQLVCLLSGVTWGKVVSLYAVAGALAVDCVRHGHPAMVHTIVDCMGEFVRKSLTSWLKRRGGWVRATSTF